MIRCPVCESLSVRVELRSRARGSCSACGAEWVQEGSWQRQVRPMQPSLPLADAGSLGDMGSAPLDLEAEVIELEQADLSPDVRAPRSSREPASTDDPTEAVAT